MLFHLRRRFRSINVITLLNTILHFALFNVCLHDMKSRVLFELYPGQVQCKHRWMHLTNSCISKQHPDFNYEDEWNSFMWASERFAQWSVEKFGKNLWEVEVQAQMQQVSWDHLGTEHREKNGSPQVRGPSSEQPHCK